MSKSRSGAPRRVAVGLLAGLLTVAVLALAPPAGAVASVTTSRVAGTTRYGTAAAVAGQPEFSGATTAILATGETFPDALAASGLAGAKAPTPIVLTQSNTYTQDAQQALNNLTKVSNVIIVGGTSAISTGVENAVKADGFTVTRVAGTDRYGTAAKIADSIGSAGVGSIGGKKTALIATGTGFADALAGGPLSYAGHLPIMLVTTDSVPASTSAELTSLGIKQVVILGGTAAVSDTVKTQLETITGNPSIRVAGTNRFGTATKVGDFEKSNLGWAPQNVLLAYGLNFPDALSGGPLGGERKAPIMLTASIPDELKAWLDANSATIKNITALGGTGVISDATLSDAQTDAQMTSNDTAGSATTRPELQSATIVGTVTPGNATVSSPAGTTIAYTFDEPIGAILAAGNFKAYTAAGTATAATSASISSSDNKVVNVLFAGITTAAGASALSTATVALGAVSDQSSPAQQNPEGDAGVGTTQSTTPTTGRTAAPDLVSVGAPRDTATVGTEAVDFTFDQTAFVQGTTGFHLVSTDGADVTCTIPGVSSSSNTAPSGTNLPGGNGSTVITAQCGQFPAAGTSGITTVSASNIARGYTDLGAVGTTPPAGNTVNGVTGAGCGSGNADVPSTTNRCNPLEASDSPDAATTTPDLVSATFKLSTTGSAIPDEVDFVFDESVSIVGTANFTAFKAYTTSGAEISLAATQVSGATVAAFATAGTLGSGVGANVRSGGVAAVAGTNRTNVADEVGVSNTTATSQSPDRTAGPDLVSVTFFPVTVGFTTTPLEIFTFDQPVIQSGTGAPVAGDFKVYLSDGTEILCTGGLVTNSTSSALTTSQVACSTWAFGPAGQVGTNTAGGTPTSAQVQSAVLGAVTPGAVTSTSGGVTNPEGSEFISGGTGTRTT